jgi:hypothetical protein
MDGFGSDLLPFPFFTHASAQSVAGEGNGR